MGNFCLAKSDVMCSMAQMPTSNASLDYIAIFFLAIEMHNRSAYEEYMHIYIYTLTHTLFVGIRNWKIYILYIYIIINIYIYIVKPCFTVYKRNCTSKG